MTTPDLERRIRNWFADEIGETEAAPSSVYAFLGAIPGSMPRERGLFGRRTFALMAAAVLLVALLAGTIAVGSGLLKLPSILPPNPSLVEASVEPVPSSSVEPSPAQPLGLIAYTLSVPVDPLPESCTASTFHSWCQVTRIWVANADGHGAREFLPDVAGNQYPIAWSPDGSQLLYSEDRGLALVALDGSEPRVLPSGPGDYFAFSPDSTRLAGVSGDQDTSVVAIYDLATDQVTLLESTRTTPTTHACGTATEGTNQVGGWSPDGTQLVVARDNFGPLDANHACRSFIFTINADGTDLALIVPSEESHQPLNASWSPDGSRIVFHRGNFANGGAGDTCDVATVRPDGSDLVQLTSDGISCNPIWTRDGRIVFQRFTSVDLSTFDLWIMDADGTNAQQVTDTTPAGLNAIGCSVCGNVLWQPTP